MSKIFNYQNVFFVTSALLLVVLVILSCSSVPTGRVSVSVESWENDFMMIEYGGR